MTTPPRVVSNSFATSSAGRPTAAVKPTRRPASSGGPVVDHAKRIVERQGPRKMRRGHFPEAMTDDHLGDDPPRAPDAASAISSARIRGWTRSVPRFREFVASDRNSFRIDQPASG